jgi:hydrogenase nickel incorporation protein HypB
LLIEYLEIMCSTCGCGVGEGGATILKPGEFANTGEFQIMDDHHHHNQVHDHTQSHTTSTDKRTIIEVEKEILGHNQLLAERNRGFFEAKKITEINLVCSPGSGKT